jgi:hypothetical protein
MMTGVELIAQERREQVEKHGWTAEHDDQHINEELQQAAAMVLTEDDQYWPEDWDTRWQAQIMRKTPKERLVIVGALIAAEIDRLNRLGE